jgi:O-antigen/teichoic acid export membrane protein
MLNDLILRYKENIRFQQVFKLMTWNFIGIPLGIVTNIVVTRFLGAKNYGDYMFINNIFNITILIINLGLFQAANRALVLTKDKQTAQEYYGSQLVITGFIYILMIVSLFIFGLFDQNIEEKGIKSEFFYIIPFGFVYLLIQFFEVLFQADNRIELLIKTRYYPKLGFFVSAGLIYLLFQNFTGNRLFIIWAFFLSTQIIVYFFVIKKINVSFKNLKQRIKEIWGFNKSFGFNVYLGSLFSNVFAQLAGILISYFGINNSGVGFYSLALTLVAPLSLIPNVIATTHYKEFSNMDKAPRKVLILIMSISVAALIALWLIIPPFIHYFYKKEFAVVINLSYIVSVGVILYGLSDFFNRFLGAHGDGKALRNSSIIVGIVILIGNIILIPKWHEYGAAFTYLLAGIVYFMSITWYYRKIVKRNQEGKKIIND